jgi:hypothetical protein
MQPVLRRKSKPVYPEDLEEGLARYSSAMQVCQLVILLGKGRGWRHITITAAAACIAWPSAVDLCEVTAAFVLHSRAANLNLDNGVKLAWCAVCCRR